MTSCFPELGGSITDLSVADNCLFGTAMEPVLPQYTNAGLVNIDHYCKFIQQERPQCGGH